MSSEPLRIRRKNNFNLVREAKKLGSFDDFPMLRPEVDPQIHASANTVDQPFFLSGQKDMVLGQFTGETRVEFVEGPVRYFDLVPGEYAYIPAGAQHRIFATKPGTQVRYKAREPGSETVTFRCETCGKPLFSHSFDATQAPAQAGYQAACEAFNADEEKRICASCGDEAEPVALDQFRWSRVAATLLMPEDDEEEAEAGAAAH